MTDDQNAPQNATSHDDAGPSAYSLRVRARLERLRARAAAKRAEAERTINQAHHRAKIIPFGQPILVGHHSEKRDRNFRAKLARQMERGFAALKEADQLERRAEAAENHAHISSDDPEAIQKLKEKHAKLAEEHEQAKRINGIIRTCQRKAAKTGADWTILARAELVAAGFSGTLADAAVVPDFAGRVGVPGYRLDRLTAEIRRLSDRILVLERAQTSPEIHERIGEVSIDEDRSENRIRLTFPGKPSEDVRKLLKSRGFRWSPTVGAWQRQCSDAATYEARQIARAYSNGEAQSSSRDATETEPNGGQ